MPRPMSDQDIMAFLMESPRTGHIATVRADGRPHVTAIWFTVDGGDIVFATSSASVKGRNLGRSAFAAFSVDDIAPPVTGVMVEGPVFIDTDMTHVRRWLRVIAGRYIGDDQARSFSEMDELPDDMVCRLAPSHMTGMTDMLGV